MGIISKVGRKTAKNRVLIGLIYAVLIAGSVTMVYPFGIMLTASVSNRYDYERFDFLPRYFVDRDELLMKYVFEKHQEAYFPIFAAKYELVPPHLGWRPIQYDRQFAQTMLGPVLAEHQRQPTPVERRVDDFLAFKQALSPRRFLLHFRPQVIDTFPKWVRQHFVDLAHEQAARWRAELVREQSARGILELTHEHNERLMLDLEDLQSWGGQDRVALRLLRQAWDQAPESFDILFPPTEVTYYLTKLYVGHNRKALDWLAYKASRPAEWKCIVPARVYWQLYLTNKYGGIRAINRAWGTTYRDITVIPFHGHRAPVPAAADDVTEFLRKKFPRRLISLSKRAARRHTGPFQKMAERQDTTIANFNQRCGTRYKRFADVRLPTHAPRNLRLWTLWAELLEQHVDPADMILWDPEQAYRELLLEQHGSLAAINRAHGTQWASVDAIMPPYKEADVVEFLRRRTDLLWTFPAQNFRRVIEFISLKGYALWNTLILVSLSIFASLTVNPMAAYALSRYSLKSSHRILIFLLATMAFPAEVAMIPNFLLLRDLGLLNTYAALVLPGLANGYWIFLLKGFFDSLPRELYEAGQIDGASEFTMFRVITLPLSKPILAVIALGAFNAAYTGFMWAFVVCQRKDMWTIMVWLFQFQQTYTRAPYNEPYLVMASLVIVSIPTLAVFLFCQKIILRGIIIPTMK